MICISKDEFYEFEPGMTMDDFPEDKIPLLQMEHLRQMDYVISRGISFERTAHDFLTQVELNDRLQIFKQFESVVVLLDTAGAMIYHNKVWYLIFTPDSREELTLHEDSEMYPVYKNTIKAVEKKEKCIIRLDNVSAKSLMSNVRSINILDNYCRNYPGGYLQVAEKVVIDGPETLYKNVPVSTHGSLTTVDLDERESYDSIKDLMSDYIYNVDNKVQGSSLMPLSIAVFGAPGSGKSFGVKQIAKSLGRFDVFTINLSQYKTYDEMLIVLDGALSASEDIPLIFFDEFDSEYNGIARGWLKFLLAPMQDGEFTIGIRTVEIKKAVFVFAGGTASTFNEFIPGSDDEFEQFKSAKGPDFVSRLKGTLNVKGPDKTSITDRAYIIRRALLLRELLIRKIPGIYDSETGTINISPGLLSALLRTSTYRHGTRSLEFIIDMSRVAGVKKFIPACLPLPDQLDIHVDRNDFYCRLASERISVEAIDNLVQLVHDIYCSQTIASAVKRGASEIEMHKIESSPRMQSWERLDEETKDSYSMLVKRLIESMESSYFPIGIRPKAKLQSDTITELFGSQLNRLTELFYAINIESKREKGWRYGETEDTELLLSPDIRNFDELSIERQEEIQLLVRSIPKLLKDVGLELYQKAYVLEEGMVKSYN